MNTVLITGATGYVGTHLVKSYLEKGYKVIACARTTENLEQLKSSQGSDNLITETLDVTDASKTLETVARHIPDVIIHAAAFPRRKTADQVDANLPFEQTPLYKLNVGGAHNLALAAAQLNHEVRLCFISSGAVFKQNLQHVDLESPRELDEPFARSKNIAEQIVESALSAAPQVKMSILYPPVILDKNQTKGIIPMAAEKALQGQTIENNAPINDSVNMLLAEDFCKMVQDVTEKQTAHFARYPINGYRIAISDLLENVAKSAAAITGNKVQVIQGEVKFPGMPQANESAIRELIGPTPWQDISNTMLEIVNLQYQRMADPTTVRAVPWSSSRFVANKNNIERRS